MKVNALTDLETMEVSLVPAGANKKGRFPIMKTERLMSDTLHAVLDAPSSSDEHFDEVIKEAGIANEGAEAIKSAMKLLSAYSDIVNPTDAVAAVAKAFPQKQEEEEEEEDEAEKSKSSEEEASAKAEDEEEAVEEPVDEEVEKPEEDEDEELKKKALVKSLEGVPPAIKEELERVWKSNEELTEVIRKERDERLRKEFIEKAAEDYPSLPGSTPDEWVSSSKPFTTLIKVLQKRLRLS